MREFLKKIDFILIERLGNPLFASFFASWCIWNWRVLILAFSKIDAEKKIKLISDYIDNSGEFNCVLWAYPLSSAVVYVLLYHWISILPFEFWEKQKIKLKKIKQSIEDETPITQAQATELRKLNFEKLREIQQENDELQQRNLTLLAQLNETKAKLEELSRTPSKLTYKPNIEFEDTKPKNHLAKLPTETIDALKQNLKIDDSKIINCFLALVNYGGTATISDISKKNNINKIEVEHSFEALRNKNILDYDSGFYGLSPVTRKLVVNLNLT